MFIRKIGIDLGTTNSLVFIPGKGVMLNEPTVVAISLTENKVLAVGQEAKEMVGKTPETIVAHRPMKDGVIADYRITTAMLRYFLDRTLGKFRVVKPEVMISVPAGITSTERRAVIEAAKHAGARAAYVVKEPILAAIGAGLRINSPSGAMIVNSGGGTTEIAVLSLGGIVSVASVRVAGNKLDTAIMDYLKRKYNVAIGERTAEDVKIAIGSAYPLEQPLQTLIRGRDLISGLPKEIKITDAQIRAAIARSVRMIVNNIKGAIEDTPPELVADIMTRGIVLAGGGALLRGLDNLVAEETQMPVKIAEDPLTAVARGAGIVLEEIDTLSQVLVDTEFEKVPT